MGTASFAQLKSMYDKDPSETTLKKIKKKIDNHFEFLLQCSEERKGLHGGVGLGMKEFVLLSRLYFRMEDTFKDFKIDDYTLFWIDFKKSFDNFCGKVPADKYKKTIQDDKGTRTIIEAMRGYLGEHKTLKKIEQSVNWLLEDLDIHKHVTLKDPQRAFDRQLIEEVLVKQEYKDYIDGEPLTMNNACGAHIIAHSDGGKTVPSNLAVTSIEHNRRMGSMNLETYKKMLSM